MNVYKLLLLSLMIASCQDGMMGESVLTEGTYVGMFQRTDPLAKFQPAHVNITILGDGFEGNSSIRNYPAICRGRLTSDGGNIEFTNDCMFTADFDWSLILKGTYRVTTERNTIALTKSYGNGRFDTYTLTRQ